MEAVLDVYYMVVAGRRRVGPAAADRIAEGICRMKPVDIVRIAGKGDKRALWLDVIDKADMALIEQVLAPMWKNLDTEYVRGFVTGAGAGVHIICRQRECPTEKTIEVAAGTTIAGAKDAFGLGFFTVGGTTLVPFINDARVEDSFELQGGETVEFKLP